MGDRIFQPTAAQRRIIESPPGERLIVDAGPGTGKTATAAARVLHLLANGISPKRLWMVSFARAAVAEMRQRLLMFGGDLADLPQVTTLDSLAWRLRGRDMDGEVIDGFDAAIAETLALLRGGDPVMLKRLGTVQHILFDETQDMVGHRAALTATIIDNLPTETGVTILTDEAQAIYGFSAGSSSHALQGETLAQHFLEIDPQRYRLHILTDIHRTDQARLLRLFARTRREVVRPRNDARRKLAAVRRAVDREAKPWLGRRESVSEGTDTLILYRSRAEVLAEATRRFESHVPFRLRLSGLPPVLYPWLATIFADWDSPFMREDEFLRRWEERIGGNEGDPAWKSLLASTQQTGRVQMSRLHHLSASRHPPLELCLADPGHPDGSVIGTIHASKGREMENVRLMMPRISTGRDDPEAEARVLFVGATRARQHLELGKGSAIVSKRLPSGRVLMRSDQDMPMIELGRPGDFEFLTAAPHYAETVSILKHGDTLALVEEDIALLLKHGGEAIAEASPGLRQDLRQARTWFHPELDYRQVGMKFEPVYCLCLSAIAPGQSGKFFMAPVIAGFSRIAFYRQ